MAVEAVKYAGFAVEVGPLNASRPPGKHPSADDRSPMAVAVEKASEVTTIAFMMVFPALLGYWLDLYLGSVPVFAIIGLILGMFGGIRQLIQLVNRPETSTRDKTSLPSSDEREVTDE